MKSFKKSLVFFSIVAIVAAVLLFSCDGLKNYNEDYKIFAFVTCDGSNDSGTFFNSMTVNYYIDKEYPFTIILDDTLDDAPNPAAPDPQLSFVPPKKMQTITITATKTSPLSTINIIVYKMSSESTKIVKFINLPSCFSATTSCTNTISLTYDVNEEKAKAAAGGTTTSTSSSSTGSSSTSSSSTGSSSTSSSTSSTGG